MEVKIIFSADESALEFSRNLGGIMDYVKEALMKDALEKDAQEASVPEVLIAEAEENTVAETKATITEKPMTLEEVRAVAAEFLEKNPKKLAKVIHSFGVGKVPELKPEQYSSFVEALNA